MVTYGGDLPKADWQSQHIEGIARAAYERGEDGHFDAPLISEIKPNLWVGGYLPVELPQDFTHVLSLYRWGKYKFGPNTEHREVEMYDSGDVPDVDQMNELADWVNAAHDAGGKVLVHCQAGLNRSNLITALALIKNGMPPDEAIALLREKRSPLVLCNAAFETWLLYQGES